MSPLTFFILGALAMLIAQRAASDVWNRVLRPLPRSDHDERRRLPHAHARRRLRRGERDDHEP